MRRIYLASAYGRADFIETIVRPKVEVHGFIVTSSWHEKASGPEQLDRMTEAQRQRIIEQNDHDIASADVMLLLAEAACRETYAEAARALILDQPVVWVGDTYPLSAYRHGVTRCSTLAAAMDVLVGMKRERRTA
jgi:hypothetical protein